MTAPIWQASGLVALTTDFGTSDPYVGLLKAVILSRAPAARIVDVTHGVPAQDVRVGAFFLVGARRYFPAGTVHVAVVDPGVGSARALLVAHDEGQCFLGPDNGLLSLALGPAAQVYELDAARFALPHASSTFHGRDILAPAAAAIASGLDPADAGVRRLTDWSRLEALAPDRSADGRTLTTEVLFRDHYGNLVLALPAAELQPPLEDWSCRVRGRDVRFARTYAQVRPGEALLLVDSFGAVEIAVRDGDAARDLGLSRGDRVTLERAPGRGPETRLEKST